MGENNNSIKEFRKSILPADLIDRAAIFTVNRYGFTVYICTKGNLHEYKHTVNYGIYLFFCNDFMPLYFSKFI